MFHWCSGLKEGSGDEFKGCLCSDEISGKNYGLKTVAKKANSSMKSKDPYSRLKD